jgi:glyoxylase-like metal-dependent hydrolase (beta-lactamase superfamily II)
MADDRNGGVFTFDAGGVTITALSDGEVEASFGLLRGIQPDDAARLLHSAGRPVPPRISVNCYALHLPEGIVLVDTGAGSTMPGLGRLPERLAQAGIAARDIVAVLLTHVHPDHSNGLTDASGNAVFPRANLIVHRNEMSYWFDDERMMRASPRRRDNNFVAPRRQFAPYMHRLRTFDAESLFEGVEPVALHGHTPGHTGYLVGSGPNRLLIWGDVVHVPSVQIPRPDVSVVLDEDAGAAAATRRQQLARAADQCIPVAGMHVDFPGLIRITRVRSGFTFQPLLHTEAP